MFNGPNFVKNGLVLYLDAGNTKSYPTSGVTWSDISGNVNNGILTNGPTFNILNKGTINFDGVNDHISFNDSVKSLLQGQTNITIGLMFKLNVNDVLRGLVGTLRYNCGKNLGLVSSNGNLSFYNDYDNTCHSVGFNNYVTSDVWVYGVATYDGTTTTLYGIKNNILSKTTSTLKSGPTNIFDYPFEIMRGGSINFSNGQVANVFLYNRTLSETEVQQNYNATKGRFGL